jgi:(4-(4-[2-(gamma-L-glutamylamino)ethyl]phenoxymethyl)furan-2-yl)methanamine synthase
MAVVGWDIGGAHLKAARAERSRIIAAVQVAAPLRLGLERVREAFAEAKALIGPAEHQFVTMTGELADTFTSRAEGVANLSALAVQELSPSHVMIYAGRAGFVAAGDVTKHVTDIASANWFASATILSRSIGACLFVDVGSTTADIVPVANNIVAARGYTDAERLAMGELVYTGMVRSTLAATCARVPFAGSWTQLFNENFANMADVHRILGSLPEGADQMTTADGRAKTVAASQARLARIVGCDAGDADAPVWKALAQYFAEAQIRAITDGAMLVLSQGRLPADAPVVAAGIGVGLVREVARRLSRECVEFATLVDVAPSVRAAGASAAPAMAVAILGSLARDAAGGTQEEACQTANATV